VPALGVLLLALAAWLRTDMTTPFYNARSEEAFVEIPRGANTAQIADLLVNSGILHHRISFILYARYANLGRHIQAGEYRFAEAANPMQVAKRLARGDVYFRSVTIPEGLTARETVELLAQNGVGELESMERLLLRTDWIHDLDPKARSLEGYLFPETYRFSRKADSETVIKTMVHQFRKRIARLMRTHPPPPGWSIARIVTLASMIEKEVKQPEEGRLVASVLMNRLRKGMPMDCDATIVYAMKLDGTYRGNLSKADLAMESPYNSYTHPNLPPGPISNPGDNSLIAALTPAHTDYLYYVSRNDGTHQFSKDFASHQSAVNRFQKFRRK
jgi:UPF0755 protein